MLQSEQFKTESLSQSTASGVHMPIDCGRSARQHLIAWKENMMEEQTHHLKIGTDQQRPCYFPVNRNSDSHWWRSHSWGRVSAMFLALLVCPLLSLLLLWATAHTRHFTYLSYDTSAYGPMLWTRFTDGEMESKSLTCIGSQSCEDRFGTYI